MPVDSGRIGTMHPLANASPWVFFLLVFSLSIPFYVLGMAEGRLPLLPMVPSSALMAVTPMLAALILVHRASGMKWALALLRRAVDFNRIHGVRWYLAALFLMPFVCVTEYAVLRLTGVALPALQIAPGEAISSFLIFFGGAIGEELGWQGYAYPALRTSWSTLKAAVILGVIWALWHVIPFVEMGRSVDWIVWQCLGTVAMRVIIVWLYVNARRSVFIAVLFHTMVNVAWSLFPSHGSHYDPFVAFLILMLVTGLIIAFWHLQNEPTEGMPHG
jgi:membrane protease YdiL (CAAX protease family)